MSQFSGEKPSKWVMRFRAVQRNVIWRTGSRRLPLYLVTEFPKSGGTWFAKMLAACTGVPFPDPQAAPRLKTMILRDTKLYHPNYHNIVAMMRDGRDVMVSAYHHFLFHNESNISYGVENHRAKLQFDDYDNIEYNLPRFIEYMFEEFPKNGWSTRFNWAQFVDSWADKDCCLVRYEDLLSDTAGTMARVLAELGCEEPAPGTFEKVADQFSFKNMTGRKPGEAKKNTFARKGIAGDWKNVFSPAARERFNHYAGPQLIRLGYEKDNSWVTENEC